MLINTCYLIFRTSVRMIVIRYKKEAELVDRIK